jgi:hypothetical protein
MISLENGFFDNKYNNQFIKKKKKKDIYLIINYI